MKIIEAIKRKSFGEEKFGPIAAQDCILQNVTGVDAFPAFHALPVANLRYDGITTALLACRHPVKTSGR